MKIRIEIEDSLDEEEIIIRCRKWNEEIAGIREAVTEAARQVRHLVFYQGETEYYLPLDSILFFETEGRDVRAHTAGEMYSVRYRLYELEEMLPGHFMRVSKSTILNTRFVYSIERNLAASSTVQFRDSHKQVFVSRNYYKALRARLEEKRLKL